MFSPTCTHTSISLPKHHSYCNKKFLPSKLSVHLRFFCGPDAKKSEALAKQQRKKKRGTQQEQQQEEEEEESEQEEGSEEEEEEEAEGRCVCGWVGV